MKVKSEEQLKEEYLSWLESIKIKRIVYEQAKFYLKENEKRLITSKRIFNLTYKDWKQARLEAERSKRRWKTQPYKLRKWAKEHMDKVFELFDKLHFCNGEFDFKDICYECKIKEKKE